MGGGKGVGWYRVEVGGIVGWCRCKKGWVVGGSGGRVVWGIGVGVGEGEGYVDCGKSEEGEEGRRCV